MSARYVVATRLAVACFALVTVVAFTACGGGGGGSDQKPSSEIAFTQGALSAVPLVRPPAPAAALRMVGTGPANISDIGFAAQLFKLQCRRPLSEEAVDYCPPGTPSREAYGTEPDPYGLSMQTLIGFIYHAQMYTTLVTDCADAGDPKTVTASSYAAHDSTGAIPTRYIVDEYGTYTCRSTHVADPAHETRMVSAVADGSYQTTLHTRYQYVAEAGGAGQTDFFQVDVTRDGSGAPTFLAFNFASATPFASRLVLLVNLTNHKFAVKYTTPEQGSAPVAPQRYAVAVGKGGFDLATGQPNAGHYQITVKDDPGTFSGCVDNATGDFVAATTCDGESVPSTWTSTSIASYLDVPTATATRIAAFLSKFSDGNPIDSTWVWAATDENLYWPASLN